MSRMLMMRRRIMRGIIPLAFGCAFMLAPGITAQESASSPATCGLAPLELPLFGGTPVAELATPGPIGSPATQELRDGEIEAALEQYVACTNTGDPALIWAVFSPRWLAANFADPQEHYLPAFEFMLTLPEVPGADPLQLVQIHEITPLPDGAVDVTATFASGDMEWTDTLTLVQIGKEWLVDDVRLDDPVG